MTRRPRKWAKWTCTATACAAVALAVLSRFFWFQYAVETTSGDTEWHAKVGSGLASVTRYDVFNVHTGGSPVTWTMGRSHNWYWGYAGEANPSFPLGSWRAGLCCGELFNVGALGASLLYPIALTLIPAALLWYTNRRRFGPGSCKKCGYDSRGLAPDAKCPECGTVLAPRQSSRAAGLLLSNPPRPLRPLR
jgi:hypothetical protein